MAKTQMCYFLTAAFYDEYDERQIKLLRGYHSKAYAQAVCDRLMKYYVDRNNWAIACQKYLDAHPVLQKLNKLSYEYPKTRAVLARTWEKANPLVTTAKQHNRSYFITETPIKTTPMYRLYEDKDEYGYEDEVTITCMWNLKNAEAFKEEHNRYANEREAWIRKSFEHAHTNPELIAKRRECQEIKKKLDTIDKADSKYGALENRWYELLHLTSDMFDNLSNMWKASNPFITTAKPQNGECFIETLTIQ